MRGGGEARSGNGALTLLLLTGEGSHAAETDVATLRASPSWCAVAEVIKQRFGHDLAEFITKHLGDHSAPHSPVISTLINLLNTDRWRATGHVPHIVLGQSIGEVVAAFAASLLSVEGVVDTAATLGLLGSEITGGMLHLRLTREEVDAWADSGESLCLSTVNGNHDTNLPELLSVTLCGATEALVNFLSANPAAKLLPPAQPWHHPAYLGVPSVPDRSGFATLPEVHSQSRAREEPRSMPRSSGAISTTVFVSATTAEAEPRLDASFWSKWLATPFDLAAALTRAAAILLNESCYVIETGAHDALRPIVITSLCTAGARVVGSAASMRRGQPGSFWWAQRNVLNRQLQRHCEELGTAASPGRIAPRRMPTVTCNGVRIVLSEVDQALRAASPPAAHFAGADLLAFAAPHADAQLGEVVGVAFVASRDADGARPTLSDLQSLTKGVLPPSHQPRLLIFMEALPTGCASASARSALAKRLCLPLITAHSPDLWEMDGDCVRPVVSGGSGGLLLPSTCAMRATLQAQATAELLRVVISVVEEVVQTTAIDPHAPLMDAGLDSLSATRLASTLKQATGVDVPPTVVFQFSTAEAIATHLSSQLAPPAPHEPEQWAATVGSAREHSVEVRVASTTGRWPGGASDAHALARLADAHSVNVAEVPGNRWLVPAGATAARHMASMANIDFFDTARFSISPAEASWMDPQQRLLMETGYTALHDARRTRSSLLASMVGVVVGIQAGDFAQVTTETPVSALPVYAVSGFTFSVAAGRLSYIRFRDSKSATQPSCSRESPPSFRTPDCHARVPCPFIYLLSGRYALGLQAACYSVDTACSTALVTTHAAATMVRDAECESALTAAVNLMLLPLFHKLLSGAGKRVASIDTGPAHHKKQHVACA